MSIEQEWSREDVRLVRYALKEVLLKNAWPEELVRRAEDLIGRLATRGPDIEALKQFRAWSAHQNTTL